MAVLALTDTGARENPLITGIYNLGHIIVGHHQRWRIFPPTGYLCISQDNPLKP